ncbi:uncharacterized protein TM35_000111160 [Trypanosoma theileri]|uniref:PHD-type domain-containing protein n=1 Tax=Trypanosoma theileri TaxID=67003 RepID=A0A1X0NY33_9TRYP|nr:uncharacterized protein TM35_000111160 [Trypanosoma theileri]ORC89582.1 hypothetical protein TM35_000111160 [Trypanosoma theileri]
MDPAAGIFSPFHIEGGGKNGLLENAVEALGTAGRDADAVNQRDATKKNSNNNRVKENDSSRRGTPCSSCGSVYTTAIVPAGGMYLCNECAAEHEANPKTFSFPPNTLKCCPASVTEGSDGVVRCHACHGWYHFACLEIHDKTLKDYLALSTTKWYCPEPTCCENILQEKLKKKR